MSVAKYLRSSDQNRRHQHRNNCLDRTENSFLSKLFSQIAFFSPSLSLFIFFFFARYYYFRSHSVSEPLANDLILMCSFVCAQSFELLHLIYVFESSKRSGTERECLASFSFIYLAKSSSFPERFSSLLPFSIFLVL